MSDASGTSDTDDQDLHEQAEIQAANDSQNDASSSSALRSNAVPMPILIVSAEKMSELGQSFIVYCIQLPSTGASAPVKRRYSEFESLRKLLKRLYPYVLMPPIPEKHSLADYAKLQGKARDDPHIIELRKRMLQSFLNRVATHQVLGRDPLFHRFFEPGAWADVLFSQKLGGSNKQQSQQQPPISPVSTSAVLPMSLKKLKNPDLKFLDLEQYALKLVERFAFLERDSKRYGKHLSDLSEVHGELGAIINAFSLHETKNLTLGEGIESVGQIMDSSFQATASLASDLESAWTDHVHEYHQLAVSLQYVLKTRHAKHMHYEDLGDQLDNKRIYLSNLERDPSAPNGGYVSPISTSAKSSSNPITGLGKMMINGIGTIGDKIHSVMDSNPESTRRAQAAKCRDMISQLEKARAVAHDDLGKFTELVLQDIERFHERKKQDVKVLLLAFAKLQLVWVQKNIRALEQAEKSVGMIRSS